MSKMIAVCGSPGSGKTTAALKIAQELYYEKKGVILFLSPDMSVPAMAFIFPHCKDSDLFSMQNKYRSGELGITIKRGTKRYGH